MDGPEPEPEARPTHSVELRAIRRSFGPVAALAGADLAVRPGEVHALLGENGAGKTTLMRVLCGSDGPDSGQILVEGAPVRFRSPGDAMAAGIGMVHQHFTLVPSLSVAENVALGVRREGSGIRLPLDRVRRRIRELEEVAGIPVNPRALVSDLSVGARQRVEILKLLYRDPTVLVLDEPTAVLAPREVEWLFSMLRSLASEGRTVVLIAHKLDEVLGVANRITVLRRGRTVLQAPRSEVDAAILAKAMIGREPEPPIRLDPREAGAVVARLLDVRALGPRGETAVDGVTLEVRRGEIVGIGGVEGNGQHELALVLAGRLHADEGAAELPGITGLIPQDRGTDGLIPGFDLAENVALALHDLPEHRRGPLLDWATLRASTERVIADYAVQTPGWDAPARALSGGNQQKLVVGRELARGPDLLVAENPTRGLDIAATEFVRGELARLRRLGRDDPGAGRPPGIVLFSTDLDEVLALSDRLFVMVRGRLVPVPDDERDAAGVGRMMLSSGARGPGHEASDA